MERPILLIFACLCFVWPTTAQVPTLVPPTPVPQPAETANTARSTESATTRIGNSGVVRVGILYNEPPFALLSERGDLVGYDADVARAVAEAWGVETEFVQVTRQNGTQRLQSGEIDLLMGAQVHSRERDAQLDFSQTYRRTGQMVMVRADDGAITLFNLANRPVGYVAGTLGEPALAEYMTRENTPFNTQRFLLLDQALDALFAGNVDGIVGRREQLLRIATEFLDAVKLLEQPLRAEPIAIAMQRGDSGLRNLVNRTLQYLLDNGTLPSLHEAYFPGEAFPVDAMPVWDNVGEGAPTPAQYAGSIAYPDQSVLERLQTGGVLRVASAIDDASPGQGLVANFHESLLNDMAGRWGVSIQRVSGDPLEAVASGSADVAIGVEPDWNVAGRVDFSAPYLLHGDRLLVPDEDIDGFTDLRGLWIAVVDAEARRQAQFWADSVDVTVNFLETTPQTAVANVLEFNNANVIYGDSLTLIGMIQQAPNSLSLTDRWYSRDYMALALPRNDVDFRLLVNYTLQAMATDGTLDQLLRTVTPAGSDPPEFDVWPGSGGHLGFAFGG